jgi:hypothetical protein
MVACSDTPSSCSSANQSPHINEEQVVKCVEQGRGQPDTRAFVTQGILVQEYGFLWYLLLFSLSIGAYGLVF